MKVVLFAYQTGGHRLLDALLHSRHEVVLVVTHPPGEDAYTTIWSDSVQELAEQHGIPVLVKSLPDAEAGITAHIMDEELDRGAIILQERVPVAPTDTTADLFHKTLPLFGPITLG